jgi:hypothetical protein
VVEKGFIGTAATKTTPVRTFLAFVIYVLRGAEAFRAHDSVSGHEAV